MELRHNGLETSRHGVASERARRPREVPHGPASHVVESVALKESGKMRRRDGLPLAMDPGPRSDPRAPLRAERRHGCRVRRR
ncbi:unnamed protein product [Lampetra planeri]